MNGPRLQVNAYVVDNKHTVIVLETADIDPNTGDLILAKQSIAQFPRERRGCINAVVDAVLAYESRATRI